jgi:protein-tyrosine-phosphatase
LQNVAEMTKNGVGPALTQMNTAVKNVGKETTKLLANPIVATLALIATAVMAVVKGIKSSEENTAKWSAAMAKFKPFLDRNVADPWYTGDFTQTWLDICEGCQNILEELL